MQTIEYTDSNALYGRGSLPLLVVNNEYGRAVIAIQGAHLLEYRRADGREFLWLSDTAVFEPGRAIRGGIPVCLPWFGPRDGKPQHGFARNRNWQVREGELVFDFDGRSEDFDGHFSASLKMEFTQSLKLTLSVTNHDKKSLPLSWALHSYHPVNDILSTRIEGLAGVTYRDNTRNRQTEVQQGPVTFSGETDRAYLQAGACQRIENAFEVSAVNAASAVVWNPGAELTQTMSDLSDYRHFVCLERGDVLDDEIVLASGATRQAVVEIRTLASN